MAELELSAQETLDLLAYREAILGCLRSLHARIGAVTADIAAIRATLCDDAGELEAYKSNLKLTVAKAKPMMDLALRSYEDLLDENLLDEIANTQWWRN